MAEGIRFTSENSTETTDDDEKSKKKKSSLKLGSSATAVVEKSVDARAATTERPKMNAWDKLLAGLTLEKDSKIKEKNKVEGALAEFSDIKPLPEINLSAEVEKAAVEKLEPIRELNPNEINGGEVVIDLRGEDTGTDDDELAAAALPEDAQVTSEVSEDPEDPEEPSQAAGTPPPTASGRGSGGNARTSGGGGGHNNPPRPPRPTASPPPPPRPTPSPAPVQPQPASTQRTYGYNAPPQPLTPNVLNVPQAPNTLQQVLAQQQAIERALYYARRRGRGEGLLGGIIVGGLVEHFRHKSRERKMEKKTKEAFKKQEKRLENLELQHQLLKTNQLEEARKAQAERYQRKADAKQQLVETARMQMTQVEASKRTAEQQEHDKAGLIERLNAQAAEQERLEAEHMLANPENRIETSAWHSIEVDKAGHAVQETNIVYGHEYYKERQHEVGPKDVATRDSITGAAALTAATMQQSNQQTQQTQQSDFGVPPMLGMPVPPASQPLDDGYWPSVPSATGNDDIPHTNPASVVILLVALAVVVVLIFVLM